MGERDRVLVGETERVIDVVPLLVKGWVVGMAVREVEDVIERVKGRVVGMGERERVLVGETERVIVTERVKEDETLRVGFEDGATVGIGGRDLVLLSDFV
jgi:hypothetical protein